MSNTPNIHSLAQVDYAILNNHSLNTPNPSSPSPSRLPLKRACLRLVKP
jgi:hypothetical protein